MSFGPLTIPVKSCDQRLDIILFGATGFTGKLCVQFIVDRYIVNDDNSNSNNDGNDYEFKFGLAARNMNKLQAFVQTLKHVDRDTFELIQCDSFDRQAIEAMVNKTNVILSTVGPYSIYGELLVDICCEFGVDYVDLSGEFHWVRQMIYRYERKAIQTNARIVSLAGVMASVSDCAIYSAIQQMQEKLCSADNHSDTDSNGHGDTSYTIRILMEPPLSAKESGGSLSSILSMLKQNAFDSYYQNKERFPFSLCPKHYPFARNDHNNHNYTKMIENKKRSTITNTNTDKRRRRRQLHKCCFGCFGCCGLCFCCGLLCGGCGGRSFAWPEWNPTLKRYQVPIVFAGEIERMVVYRTNYLSNNEYGDHCYVYESMALFKTRYMLVAFVFAVLHFILPFLLLRYSFTRRVCTWLFEYFIAPKSGEGPDMKAMKTAKWKQYFLIEEQTTNDDDENPIDHRNKKEMRVDVNVYGDYMYYNTAKILVEQGIIFALQKRSGNMKQMRSGFLTPAIAFGDALIQRLNDLKEFEIEFK